MGLEKLVAIDILSSVPNTTMGSLYDMIITERYSKTNTTVPNVTVTTTAVACLTFDAWVVPYVVPPYRRTHNNTQFVSKFFSNLRSHCGTKQMTKTAYNPQSSGQENAKTKTSVTRLRHYVASHKRNLDLFVQQLTGAHNTQVYRFTETTPIKLFLTRHPPRATTFDNPSALGTDAYHATDP